MNNKTKRAIRIAQNATHKEHDRQKCRSFNTHVNSFSKVWESKYYSPKIKGETKRTPMAQNSHLSKRWATWATGSNKESMGAYVIFMLT